MISIVLNDTNINDECINLLLSKQSSQPQQQQEGEEKKLKKLELLNIDSCSRVSFRGKLELIQRLYYSKLYSSYYSDQLISIKAFRNFLRCGKR